MVLSRTTENGDRQGGMPKPKAPACHGGRQAVCRGTAWRRYAWPCHPLQTIGFPIVGGCLGQLGRLILAGVLLTVTAATALSKPVEGESPRRCKLPAEWVDAFHWRCIGPAVMGGRITALAVYEQDPTIWWVATASGGLLKTTNNGTTFEHQFDHENTVSIGDVAVAPSDPNIVWVGTGEANPRNSVSWGDGVYKSADGGKTWQHCGLHHTFQIGRIAIHPTNPDIVYVGALGRLWGANPQRGLFRTIDGGKNWQQVLYLDERTGVADVQLNPADPKTLLVATYERQRDEFDGNDPAKKWGPGGGLFRSTDGGDTWVKITKGLPSCALGRMGIDHYRKDPNVVYLVLESERIGQEPRNAPFMGITAENADAGARITAVTPGGPAAQAGLQPGDIVLAVNNVTVHSYNNLIDQIHKYVAGNTVEVEVSRERKGLVVEVKFSPRPPNTDGSASFGTFLGGQQGNLQQRQGPQGHEFGGVYKSTDAGCSWFRVNSVNPRPMYFSQIAVDPSDEKYLWVLGMMLHRSQDGGQTFTPDGAPDDVHVDHHALWIDPRDGRHLILGGDGGVYVTYDRGQHWTHLAQAAIGQFYHVSVDPRPNYRVYGGLQDNGTWGGPQRVRYADGPRNSDWSFLNGGDGFVCRVDSSDPDQVYFEMQFGGMGSYNLRTGASRHMRPPGTGQGYHFNWKTPFILSHHNPGIHYSAGNYVFRSLNQGGVLKKISPELARTDRGTATALAESPLEADLLYAGTDDGALWVTHNGGQRWTELIEFPAPTSKLFQKLTAGLGKWRSTMRGSLLETLRVSDADGDGKIQPGEFPPHLAFEAPNVDLDGDGVVDEQELEALAALVAQEEALSGLPANVALDTALKPQQPASEEPITPAEPGAGEALELPPDFVGPPWIVKIEGPPWPTEAEPTIAEQAENPPQTSVTPLSPPETAAPGKAAAAPPPWSPQHHPMPARPGPLLERLPGPRWVSSIEPSRHVANRVYVTFDGHRSDDDDPYVFVSEDRGTTWRSIRGNLPLPSDTGQGAGTTRVLREDLHNPNLLYLGTEFGLWVTLDRGVNWTRLHGNLPTVAVHEIAQHPTSGEIILATHGRSIWILDVTPLRQMNEESLGGSVYLFEPNDAIHWRRLPDRSASGGYVGENPPTAAEIYYYLKGDVERLHLRFVDGTGNPVRELEPSNKLGLHRVLWDLRTLGGQGSDGPAPGHLGALVPAGVYWVVLTADEYTITQQLRVEADPEYPEYHPWESE